MKTTEKQASKRLFKKLSALRATLSNEERKILDELIVNEVTAHKLNTKTSTKINPKVSEVAAHKLNTKTSTKTNPKPTSRIVFDPNSEEYKIQD